jgi:methyl-accepting chemotaxis protein
VSACSKVNILESLQKVIKEFSPLVTETQNSLLGIKNLVNTIDKTNEKLNPIVDSTINEIKILSEDLQSSAKALGAAMTLLAGSVRSAAEELSGK